MLAWRNVDLFAWCWHEELISFSSTYQWYQCCSSIFICPSPLMSNGEIDSHKRRMRLVLVLWLQVDINAKGGNVRHVVSWCWNWFQPSSGSPHDLVYLQSCLENQALWWCLVNLGYVPKDSTMELIFVGINVNKLGWVVMMIICLMTLYWGIFYVIICLDRCWIFLDRFWECWS